MSDDPEKDELEKQKLRLEIKDLKSKWKKAGSWILAILPSAVAFVSVLAVLNSNFFDLRFLELKIASDTLQGTVNRIVARKDSVVHLMESVLQEKKAQDESIKRLTAEKSEVVNQMGRIRDTVRELRIERSQARMELAQVRDSISLGPVLSYISSLKVYPDLGSSAVDGLISLVRNQPRNRTRFLQCIRDSLSALRIESVPTMECKMILSFVLYKSTEERRWRDSVARITRGYYYQYVGSRGALGLQFHNIFSDKRWSIDDRHVFVGIILEMMKKADKIAIAQLARTMVNLRDADKVSNSKGYKSDEFLEIVFLLRNSILSKDDWITMPNARLMIVYSLRELVSTEPFLVFASKILSDSTDLNTALKLDLTDFVRGLPDRFSELKKLTIQDYSVWRKWNDDHQDLCSKWLEPNLQAFGKNYKAYQENVK